MGVIRWFVALPSRALICLVKIYRVAISPLKPDCCRFEPTCSAYAIEALRVHGFFKGVALTVWRIMRCHPFYHGDLYDPVPPKKEKL